MFNGASFKYHAYFHIDEACSQEAVVLMVTVPAEGWQAESDTLTSAYVEANPEQFVFHKYILINIIAAEENLCVAVF